MGWFSKKVGIAEQLAALAKCGIAINPGVLESDLTMFQSKAELEGAPFAGLIEALGHELEREPFTPMCDSLWMCDTERIDDHGAYALVVSRLERMTRAALRLANITDYVDVEEEVAWVEFDHAGKRVHWDFTITDDWLDGEVLTKYDALLGAAKSPTRLYIDSANYGQVAFLAAFDPAQKAAFDTLTKTRLARLQP
jgi:hypothetical protein